MFGTFRLRKYRCTVGAFWNGLDTLYDRVNRIALTLNVIKHCVWRSMQIKWVQLCNIRDVFYRKHKISLLIIVAPKMAKMQAQRARKYLERQKKLAGGRFPYKSKG